MAAAESKSSTWTTVAICVVGVVVATPIIWGVAATILIHSFKDRRPVYGPYIR